MKEDRIMNCEEALRLLAEHLDGELDHASRNDVERHLERCRSCYSRAEFERRLKGQVSSLRESPVRPVFEDRIRSIIDRFGAYDRSPHPNRSK
jgi:anti-sigma factor RsiW